MALRAGPRGAPAGVRLVPGVHRCVGWVAFITCLWGSRSVIRCARKDRRTASTRLGLRARASVNVLGRIVVLAGLHRVGLRREFLLDFNKRGLRNPI